ncbi:hypothetical protein ACHAXT_001670 [Thalassiosira profunda]
MAPSAPRPGPPDPHTSSRTLHPLYAALDARNFTKALKLTAPSASNPAAGWDIVRALRAHALDRCGRGREALVLLWEILVKGVVTEDGDKKREAKEVWSELYERIVCLTDAADLVSDAPGLDVRLWDAVERLDVRAYAPIPLPKKESPVAAAGSGSQPSLGKASAKSSGKGKKGGKGKSGKKSGVSMSSASIPPVASVTYPPVTDETVLATLSVTLRSHGLSDTLSEMYSQAMNTLTSGKMSSNAEAENCKSVLEESVCVHFRAVCDCPDVGTVGEKEGIEGKATASRNEQLRAQLPRLQTLLNLAKYYDRMQTASLQLAKLTSQPLHFQWTAVSSLWYRETLQELVWTLEKVQSLVSDDDALAEGDAAAAQLRKYLLEMMGLSGVSDIAVHCQKLKQKMALLPRLAESLSSRMVLQTERPVSENDWDVYLETLLVQGKKVEALEVLKSIQGTPMTNSDAKSNDDTMTDQIMPQIDDEDTIENHVGSILPYTQRKKLERLAQLSLELGMYEEAESHYRELLVAFPDQWSYWLGLVDSCVLMGSSREISEEGWTRCKAIAQEIVESGEGKHPLRGPRLMSLELASLRLRHNGGATDKGGLLELLREEIASYGEQFGPLASCCFADVRPYLALLVQEATPDGHTSKVLQWAKELWSANSQSSDVGVGSTGADISTNESRERRKKLRTYIFAVQVVHAIAAESKGSTLELLQSYAPSTSQIATEWRTSLSFLPGVAPKDGGQKEVLPGDEIVLLTSQHLQFQAASESSSDSATQFLLRAAGLLEEAMDHSPYNPHLKIAAIGVYSQLNAAHRALAIYQDMGVKQIQQDSCSYLILPTLIRGGLYTSAIKLSSSLLRFHGATSKDIKEFASKALCNGYLFKAKEMVTFQREKMATSLQLLQCKGLVMDAAPLILPADLVSDIAGGANQASKAGPVSLGSEKGFNGSDEDLARAEQIAIDAETHVNAPAIIHAAAQSSASISDYVSSDNRDLTVNHFEILHRNTHPTQQKVASEALRSGHMQSLLARAIAAAGAASNPKKGKIPKLSEEARYRCQSLEECLSRAKEFGQALEMDDVERALWNACCKLCETVVVIIQGAGNDSTDTLADREAAVTSIIDATTPLIKSAQTAFAPSTEQSDGASLGARTCQLLPDHVVPFYVLLEITAKLFALFGWGKRKRATKAVAGALASLAFSFGDLVSDLLQAMDQYRSFGPLGSFADESIGVSADSVQRVIREVSSSRELTEERVDLFLVQMKASLDTFDEQ